ncbi:MAG: hypothetical protein ACFB22_14820 [Rhodothalassiaceae bacterium]
MRTILLTGALLFGTAASAHEVIHQDHEHDHGQACGHTAIAHDGHVDYLHDGHLHHQHQSHVDEHVIAIDASNPAAEQLVSRVEDAAHVHSLSDGSHPMVQHGDHFDFVHNGALHFVHGDHVDDHGPVTTVKTGS